ncbi:MAG: DUF1918 domain-containing protein [Acidimicrobiia bacterium]
MDLHARVGDQLVVDGVHLTEPARKGEILEVLDPESDAPHYRVRWDDGRVTIFYPGSTSHAVHPGQRTT